MLGASEEFESVNGYALRRSWRERSNARVGHVLLPIPNGGLFRSAWIAKDEVFDSKSRISARGENEGSRPTSFLDWVMEGMTATRCCIEIQSNNWFSFC